VPSTRSALISVLGVIFVMSAIAWFLLGCWCEPCPAASGDQRGGGPKSCRDRPI
jgi:hypothetical protein